MKIVSGLFTGMVLQRGSGNVCDVTIRGTSSASGKVLIEVRSAGKRFTRLPRHASDSARAGVFKARLRGLPAGGPYDIRLSIVDAAERALDELLIRNVLVGDVWVLGGQSNMQGIGLLRDAEKPASMVRAFYMDDHWDVARDPLHELGIAVDPVHGSRPLNDTEQRNKWTEIEMGSMNTVRATGPGVSFGKAMWKRTGVPQGLLACAHGGTSMAQWDPDLKKMGGNSFYGAMLRRFHKNGSRIAGVVWYQGCSDASPAAVEIYSERMKKFVAAMRRDFHDKRLPVVWVQIAGVLGWGNDSSAWNSIQDQQRRLADTIPRTAVVPAIDLDMDDTIHISGKSQCRLGGRLAQAMAVLKGRARGEKPPIRLGEVWTEQDAVSLRVVAQFENVMGRLQAPGKVSGFSFPKAPSAPGIYGISLSGNKAILQMAVQPGGQELYYGHGHFPYCNITDSADRSLPVFGPVRVEAGHKVLPQPDALFPYVRTLRVSRPMPSAGKLESLGYPVNQKPLGWKTRAFPGDLLDLHLDLFACAPKDVLVYYACRFRCRTPMKLMIGFSYDGPAKLWMDRKEIFHDPEGVNPAGVDKALIPFDADAGKHEVLMAIGSNFGKAWGAKLRFLRRDVPDRLLRRGQKAYENPVVLER